MKLLVLDGNSILNRAFYGIKLLTTKDGFFTNAIYGFLTMFQKLKEDTNPDAVAIAFDLKAPTFRHKQYNEYKANRKGMPQELAMQLPVLKELLQYLGYKIVECEGYEADDILGTLSNVCNNTDNECIIATGDRDSLQLVSQNTTVRLMSTKMGKPIVTVYNEPKVLEDYKVTPTQLIDIKAIQGDSSDNIPGVKGIGQKGATDLVSRYNSLDYIYDNIDDLEITKGMRQKLIDSKDMAYLSYKLGTIVKNAPINKEINTYIRKQINEREVIKLMSRLEMFSLLEKMDLHTENIKQKNNDIPKKEIKAITINDLSELKNIINDIEKLYLLCEYDSNSICTVAFINNDIIYIVTENSSINYIMKCNAEFYVYDCKKIYNNGFEPNVAFDAMLAAYLLNPSASDYNVKRLTEEYECTMPAKCEYEEYSEIANNVAGFKSLCDILQSKIKENNQHNLLDDIEIPLAKVLNSMEKVGFYVDEEGIKSYEKELENIIDELQEKIYSFAGHEFNINSPKQLGNVLFEELGLPSGKKLKTGYSTNAAVLEKLRYTYPIVENILQYRTLAKLKSTYCDGLLKVIGKDGRIHSNFNQTETRTGRISSTEPNLQNIPVRTEIGKELRKFFKAKKGCVLVDADYSQIELRVLAHISQDEIMIDAFKNNNDIHAITASQVFHMPLSMVTPIMRSRAKAVNFGIVYGIGAFSLSRSLEITRKEAAQYISNYLEKYKGVDNYMDRVVQQAREDGYVTTMFERRRYLPELVSSNHNLRAFGERVARNMPIQGTAADIIKIAMIRVQSRLKSENLDAKLILQIHDELIVEAPENEAKEVAEILTSEMENVVKLSVPLIAESSIGKTWYDAKC